MIAANELSRRLRRIDRSLVLLVAYGAGIFWGIAGYIVISAVNSQKWALLIIPGVMVASAYGFAHRLERD